MKWKKEDKERLKNIIKQITGSIDDIEGDLIEGSKIKGKGDIWCYSPLLNQMVAAKRGTLVYIISDEEDDKGRVLAYTGSVEVILIEKSELMEVGFN